MNAEKYFADHGFIYGISTGLDDSKKYTIYFDDFKMAKTWRDNNILNETHKLCSKNDAERWQKKYVG